MDRAAPGLELGAPGLNPHLITKGSLAPSSFQPGDYSCFSEEEEDINHSGGQNQLCT